MICPACGYKNIERGDHRCPHCGRRLDRPAASSFPQPSAPPPPVPTPPLPTAIPTSSGSGAAAALAPEWKQEVTDRLEQFRYKRARQQGLFSDALFPEPSDPEDKSDEVPEPDPGQKVVAFEDFAAGRIEPLIVEPPKPTPPTPRRGSSSRRLPPLEPAAASESPKPRWEERPLSGAPSAAAPSAAAPAVAGPPTARPRAAMPPTAASSTLRSLPPLADAKPEAAAHPSVPAPADDEQIFPREIVCPNPVAPILLRGLAAVLDLGISLIGVAVFLGTFHVLGGALQSNHKAAGATALAIAAVTGFYFFVYTCYGCETPGLQWMSLCVLDYEGRPPRPPQRFVRAVGMLISAAALGLGYLWAFADEENLTWHDRMSKSFVTRDPAAPQHLRAPGA